MLLSYMPIPVSSLKNYFRHKMASSGKIVSRSEGLFQRESREIFSVSRTLDSCVLHSFSQFCACTVACPFNPEDSVSSGKTWCGSPALLGFHSPCCPSGSKSRTLSNTMNEEYQLLNLPFDLCIDLQDITASYRPYDNY